MPKPHCLELPPSTSRQGRPSPAHTAQVAQAAEAAAAPRLVPLEALSSEMAARGRAALGRQLESLGRAEEGEAAVVEALRRNVFHPSELLVKPIVLNQAIERQEPFGQFEPRALHFKV